MIIKLARRSGIRQRHRAWLHQFQDEYVGLLATLEADAMQAAAQKWAQSEELDCDAKAVLPVVQALVALSRDALARGKGLYMWGSL